MKITVAIEQRFMNKVKVTDGCWYWLGWKSAAGYGHFRFLGKDRLAHRFAYEHFKGPIPDGLELDHLCQNPQCVNPEHLEAVTHQENLQRGNTFQARNARKKYCVRGHLLAGANCYFYRGKRICKACRQIFGAKYECKRRKAA